jgi:hypothetical protein
VNVGCWLGRGGDGDRPLELLGADVRGLEQAAASPRPGWYPDPGGTHAERWWDGAQWSGQVR